MTSPTASAKLQHKHNNQATTQAILTPSFFAGELSVSEEGAAGGCRILLS